MECNDSHIIIQSENYDGSLKGHAMVCESWSEMILMQSGDESKEKVIQLRYDISLGYHAMRSAW